MIASDNAIDVSCANTRLVQDEGHVRGITDPTDVVVIVITLLAFGCPVQAIVRAYGLDERTVAAWRDRAGKQCQRVHQGIVEQGQLDLIHVQADEIRVKARGMVAWMGLAMMVSTRLWLGGVVSRTRDTNLADRLLQQVRACSQAACALLVCTDGWAAYPTVSDGPFATKSNEQRGVVVPRCRSGRACTLGR